MNIARLVWAVMTFGQWSLAVIAVAFMLGLAFSFLA